jgi:hypothetical protein
MKYDILSYRSHALYSPAVQQHSITILGDAVEKDLYGKILFHFQQIDCVHTEVLQMSCTFEKVTLVRGEVRSLIITCVHCTGCITIATMVRKMMRTPS